MTKKKRRRKAQKGSQFERDLCKRLSRWWSKGERDDLFWRTATSGGRATTRAKSGKKTVGQSGDIAATDKSAMKFTKLITVEAKRGYTEATIHGMLDAPAGKVQQPFAKFLEQVLHARTNEDTAYWWLITRRNTRSALCSFPLTFVRDATNVGGFPEMDSGKISFQGTFAVWHDSMCSRRATEFVTMSLDDLLREVSPKTIKRLYKSQK